MRVVAPSSFVLRKKRGLEEALVSLFGLFIVSPYSDLYMMMMPICNSYNKDEISVTAYNAQETTYMSHLNMAHLNMKTLSHFCSCLNSSRN